MASIWKMIRMSEWEYEKGHNTILDRVRAPFWMSVTMLGLAQTTQKRSPCKGPFVEAQRGLHG